MISELNRAQKRKVIVKIEKVIRYAKTSKSEIIAARDAGDFHAKILLQFADDYEKAKTLDEKILLFRKFQLERTGQNVLNIKEAIMGE